MSVGDNRISAVQGYGRHLLQTVARLAAWVESRQLGLTPAQSDLIADAALNRAIETLESWERDMTESKWTDSTDDVIEFAHVIIANAMNVGNPPEDPVPGWHDAAREWIDRHSRWLATRLQTGSVYAGPTPLNDLATAIHSISRSKGFWPDIDGRPEATRNPAEVLMLIVSEATEALEAIRDGDGLNEFHYKPVTGPDLTIIKKPVGVPSEMADIVIRALDACAAWNIDIDKAVAEKIAYNSTRPHLHGRAR